jgi:hypothetical protein
LIIGGYGSWSWKSYNLVVVGKKERGEGSKIVEEKGIIGLGIPTGLREEMGLETNKRRPLIIKI